jgi:hypothetical protein
MVAARVRPAVPAVPAEQDPPDVEPPPDVPQPDVPQPDVPLVPRVGRPAFALHPASLSTNLGYTDYSLTEGRKAYERAITPLDPVYDGTQKGLQMFIHQVKRQAVICGWEHSILTIPSAKNHGQPLSLLSHYGQITVSDIASQATTYINAESRANQDASNFKVFLDGSLGKDIMMRVLAQSSKYTFEQQENGPAMFRVILGIVGIETKATIAVINATLRTLPAKLLEVKNNITVFNEYVTNQCLELTSRGQQPNDLLFLLFEAYLTASNSDFVDYIRTKESAVFDDSITDMEPENLMVMAEEKYKIMMIRKQWSSTNQSTKGTTSAADDNIIALRAAVEALTQASKKKSNKAATTTSSGNSNPTSQNTGKWAWKDIAPKDNESKFKSVGNKEYVYCPNHPGTKWVLAAKHKDGCTLDATWCYPTKDDHQNGNNESNGSSAEEAKQIKYIKALMSVMPASNGKSNGDSDDENI